MRIEPRMFAGYASGAFLYSLNGSHGLLQAIYPHFVTSVAISGSFSPQMYIHLVQAHEDRALIPSRELASLQFAPLLDSQVRLPIYKRYRALKLLPFQDRSDAEVNTRAT